MKVYVTKFALTRGILEKEVSISSTSKNMVVEIINEVYPSYYHKPYWYENKDEAIKFAEEMRVRKIESLKKSILRLEKLKFN